MIKILLVDDEIYSLQGMKQLIPWGKLGCEVCGQAMDSLTAIDLAKELKPHIIVTDINMPGKDGLEMAEEIKEIIPNCQFIVITGYDDFNYAVKAVKINVADFILKPIEEEEVIKATKKAIKNLRNSELIKDNDKKILDILRNEISINNITDFFDKDDYINIILIESDREDDNEIIKLKNIINGWCDFNIKSRFYTIKIHNNRIALISSENLKIYNKELLKLIYEANKKLGSKITIAITEKKSCFNIQELYEGAKELIEEVFYYGKGCIIEEKFKAIEVLINEKEVVKRIENINLGIESRNIKVCEKYIEKIYGDLKISKSEKKIINGITMELLILCKKHLLKITGYKISEKDFDLDISGLTLDEIKEKTLDTIKDVIDKTRECDGRLEETSIEKALKYISLNYQKNISLKTVASEVYLNESYLSRSFKKNIGMGFVEYVTKLKIEKSIGFLKQGKSIKEVSELVGYSDYRSFSSNFKKYTGYTPREYNIEK